MTRLIIKTISVVVLGLLLITCNKDTNEILIPKDAIGTNEGTESVEVYRPLEANVLDFDALIREVEAEVDLYESNEYGARKSDNLSLEKWRYGNRIRRIKRSLKAEYNTFSLDFRDDNNKGEYEKDVYTTPVYFNTQEKREYHAQKRVNAIHAVLINLYELEFLEYKHDQLLDILFTDNESNIHASEAKILAKDKISKSGILSVINRYKEYGDHVTRKFSCEGIEQIFYKIANGNKGVNIWKSYEDLEDVDDLDGLIWNIIDHPYKKKNGEPKRIRNGGDLLDIRQAKLRTQSADIIIDYLGSRLGWTNQIDYTYRDNTARNSAGKKIMIFHDGLSWLSQYSARSKGENFWEVDETFIKWRKYFKFQHGISLDSSIAQGRKCVDAYKKVVRAVEEALFEVTYVRNPQQRDYCGY